MAQHAAVAYTVAVVAEQMAVQVPARASTDMMLVLLSLMFNNFWTP
jgi:hypothetical protein